MPLLSALKKGGYRVIACGKNRHEPCHQYADESIFVDYSKIDLTLARLSNKPISAVVPSCNDYSYATAAAIARRFNLKGYDSPRVVATISNKERYRAMLRRLALCSPKVYQDANTEVSGSIKYPCLVKPVDSFSGRGISKLRSSRFLNNAINIARLESRSKKYLVEEFIDGTLHSHSAFLKNGKIVNDFFVDEYCTEYAYQVNSSNHPSVLTINVRESVRQEVHKLAGYLQLSDGLLHTQFIQKKNEIWLVESMRRCPGDLYGTLIQRSTGFRYYDAYLAPFLGKTYPNSSNRKSTLWMGRHTISSAELQIPFSIVCDIPASSVEIIPLKLSGSPLEPAPMDKFAICFIKFRKKSEMILRTRYLKRFFEVVTSKF
jgi:biotin carboxylase